MSIYLAMAGNQSLASLLMRAVRWTKASQVNRYNKFRGALSPESEGMYGDVMTTEIFAPNRYYRQFGLKINKIQKALR